jgi:hypothetical protein
MVSGDQYQTTRAVAYTSGILDALRAILMRRVLLWKEMSSELQLEITKRNEIQRADASTLILKTSLILPQLRRS